MPVEIRELIIKPTVSDGSPGSQQAGNSSMSAEEKEALIREIVSRVLEELNAIKTRSSVLPDSFR